MKSSKVAQVIFALFQLKIIKHRIRQLIFDLFELKIIKSRIAAKKITKCLVLFHPRSGSSWLIKLLEENKNFRVGYEILGDYQYSSGSPNEVEQLSILNNFYNSKIDQSTLAWDNRNGVWVSTVGSKIVSLIKSFRYQDNIDEITIICKVSLFQTMNKETLINFIKSNKVKVICLTRDDLFKLVVSQYRTDILYKKIGEYNITENKQDFILGSTQLEKDKFISCLELCLLAKRNILETANLLVQNQVDIFNLSYENLFKNNNSCLQELEDFIGTQINVRQTKKIFKVTDDNLQTIVSNYDKCKEWMDEYLKAHEIDSEYAK